MVERLSPFYEAKDILPVFFVWESGLFETIKNNAREIFDEKIFKALLKMLLKWAGGKVAAAPGGRGIPEAEPLDDMTVAEAIAQARTGVGEPLSRLDTTNVAPLTSDEQQAFEKDLRSSDDFRSAFDSIMLGLGAEPPQGRAPAANVAAAPTLMSESVKNELRASVREEPGGRSLFSFDPVHIAIRATAVLARVVKRCLQHRDHGLYTTVVEELLRELYIDAIGTWVWQRMKKDTLDTFGEFPPDAPRGGRLLIRRLAKELAQGAGAPKISIVGHSAGSIFACHMMEHVDQQRRAGALPTTFTFDRMVFLAPACQEALFKKVLDIHGQRPLFQHFRLYSLGDALEAGYWEAPPLYPRSLLYMISGLLEQPEYDMPLLGMQRYLVNDRVYNETELAAIRRFLSSGSRQVWAEASDGDGLRSNANRHGGFDATSGDHCNTMDSVAYFISS